MINKSPETDLGNELNNAFFKCCKCNEGFTESLQHNLIEFDTARKEYNQLVSKYVHLQDTIKFLDRAAQV